jgi:6-phosphogluconate dehydrogenase (decarboxylating)
MQTLLQVGESGVSKGRWTIHVAIDEAIPALVMTMAL